jgi:hypothetical protein
MSANPKLISTVRNPAIRIQNADGTTFKSLAIAPPGDGARVKALHITSDDTADQVLQFAVTIGGVDYVLGEISVPDGSGTNSTDNAVNGLNATKMPALQTDGIAYWLDLATGSDLKVRSKTAVTAGKTINVFTEVGDFT